MAYDEGLAARVREVVAERPEVAERKMFGGLCWFVGGHMACGVMRMGLVVRLTPEDAAEALGEPGTAPFGRPGARPMKGFVLIDEDAVADDAALADWVDRGTAFAGSLPPKA